MEKQVERYTVSIYILLDMKYGKLDCYNYTLVGSYDIDGEKELIKLLQYFNESWYKIEIQNYGKVDFKYRIIIAINEINNILEDYEKETY